MHSGFGIPGTQQIQHEPAAETSRHNASLLLSMSNQIVPHSHVLLEQIHSNGGNTFTTQQLFMDQHQHRQHQHHFIPPPPNNHHQYYQYHPSSRVVNNHYVGPTTAPSAYFPLNIKLGLSEQYCSRDSNREGGSFCIGTNFHNNHGHVCVGTGNNINEVHGDDDNDGADLLLLRGSEQYHEQASSVPEARHMMNASAASLGMLHCWQNQGDSAIINNNNNNKQPPFWEAEVSNENSEIVDRQDNNLESIMNNNDDNKHAQEANCNNLEAKSRVQFGELEAIYKRIGSTTAESDQTGPSTTEPVNKLTMPHHRHHQQGSLLDHGSENSTEEYHHQQEESASFQKANTTRTRKRKKKTNKTKKKRHDDVMIDPMTEFFGNLVKQVMEHQENLHKKFAEVVQRLDEERRKKEEVWRSQELAHFERDAAELARERVLAESREATVISYLEKITGEKINLPSNFYRRD